MPTLEDLNRVVAATRVLATEDSGYHPVVARAITDLFADYVHGRPHDVLDFHVLNLADAIMRPLEVGA